VYTTRTLSVFPTIEDTQYSTFSDRTYFSDIIDKGNSDVSPLTILEDSSVLYTYRLGDSSAYPYSGLNIHQNGLENFDFSSYDLIHCFFGEQMTPTNFVLYIKTFANGYSYPTDEFTYRYNRAELTREVDQRRVTIKRNDLKTPDWWFTYHKLQRNEFEPRPDWKQSSTFCIESSLFSDVGKEYTMHIENIVFARSKKPFIISFLALLLSLLVLVWDKRKRGQVGVEQHVSNYEQITIDNSTTEEFNSIIAVMGKQYGSSDFSVGDLVTETGLSQRKIARIFREESGETFNRYLNRVRLEEAKRLILTTDRRITEIAYLVGYNYPSHFNKLFSERYKQTPSEMRETYSEA